MIKASLLYSIAIGSMLLFFPGLSAQNTLTSDVNFLTSQLNQEPERPQYPIARRESNEIKMGVQFLFLFYKNFLSSQDNRNCAFAPSCSTYCLQSIQHKGVFQGLMGSFDRLSRCNYLSPENYTIDRESGQLLDPVD